MNKESILEQCLEWNKDLGNSVPGWKDLEMKRFTEDNINKLSKPKYDVHSICSQTIHSQNEYPIFFIRERQIFDKEEEGLTWVYFGSLFDIVNGEVNYRTTPSFIPERYIKDFELKKDSL